MKVGDLVRIRERCKSAGGFAIISELSPWGGDDLKIQIIDQGYKEIWSRIKNLELVKDDNTISKR